MKKILIIIVIFGNYMVIPDAFCQSAEDFFAEASKKYADDDYEGAIADLEKCLSMDPSCEPGKYMLGLCLNLASLKCLSGKDYEKAIKYINKYLLMYLEEKQAEPSSLRPVIEKKFIDDTKLRSIITSVLRSQLEQQRKNIGRYHGTQKKIIETMLAHATERQEKILAGIQKQTEKSNRVYILVGIGGTLIVVGLIIFLIILTRYYNVRRETALMKYQERIIKLLRAETIPSERQWKVTDVIPQQEISRMLTGKDYNSKLHCVDVIEAELIEETDKEIAKRLLLPFLDDEDSRIKTRAAKVMYQYNPQVALGILASMVENPDKEVYTSAIHALGEISDRDTINVLLEKAGSIGPQRKNVQKEIVNSMSRIYKKKDGLLDSKIRDKIDIFLKEMKSKYQWIID